MKYRTAAAFICVLFAGAALWGCARVDPQAPPDVTYGVSVCADCGMIISDERYATALVVEDARGRPEVLLFDDAGDQIIYERENQTGKVLARWVHDQQTREWLRAESAWYMRAKSLPTPMASGIAAFAQKADAERLAGAHNGVVLTFEELWFAPPPTSKP
ncbi:MAG: nitrous oxide reductase accessory protein NosL [Phycisphaerales bacterium]|nr:nitrous oxide reductase accessory protein NosL [Phycisphaerales bacterium]